MCPFKDRSNYPVSKSHILIVASSEQEASIEYSGWKQTCVTTALCPVRVNFGGIFGNNYSWSSGDKFFLNLVVYERSSSYSIIFYSNSITFFCSLIIEIHFFSKISVIKGFLFSFFN